MRFAFYISGAGTRLRNFLEQGDMERIRQIELVISDACIPDALANILNIQNITYKEISYEALGGDSRAEKNLALSGRILELLEAHEIDYCFSFGSHLLSGPLLERYHMRLINFHPSLLPMFPGIKAIDQAARQGTVFLAGNTAHFIDAGMDTGPVIMQSAVPFQAFYDSGGDYECILNLQTEMLGMLMDLLSDGRIGTENERVKIRGADYHASAIFPAL